MLMELTPEQQDRIRLLLEEELRDAVRLATGQGARPAEVAALVEDRRQALAELRAGFLGAVFPELRAWPAEAEPWPPAAGARPSAVAEDAQDPLDDAGQAGGVAEPRG
jgi:hypothetical protein